MWAASLCGAVSGAAAGTRSRGDTPWSLVGACRELWVHVRACPAFAYALPSPALMVPLSLVVERDLAVVMGVSLVTANTERLPTCSLAAGGSLERSLRRSLVRVSIALSSFSKFFVQIFHF